MNSKRIFSESQKFSSNWLVYIMLLPLSVMGYGLYKQLILDQPFGNNPISNSGLVIIFGILIIFTILIFSLKVITIIDSKQIKMQFFPFLKRRSKLSDIKDISIIDYGFVGGWGIRLSSKYGIVYNVKGTKGILIILKSGKTYVIGTQKEEELRAALKKIKGNYEL